MRSLIVARSRTAACMTAPPIRLLPERIIGTMKVKRFIMSTRKKHWAKQKQWLQDIQASKERQ